ncbi:MAG: 1-acyl-sn-glycerol-3-phosphate acyltransferase [Chloroflexi bacterium]|nr:MAG: 1-acyl-sn-glycerol-3-phosphate acyltransferase [Chloroflexota bacterium]
MFQKLLYWISKPLVLSYTGTALKMDVHRQEQLPAGAKIIAANHPSTTDPFFVASMLRTQSFILINNLLFQVPVLGEYLRRSGHIPVIAGSGQAALDVALEHLAQGHTVMIFPEGDLSPENGGFQDPRTGVARLALLSGAPVIPVGIYLQRSLCRTIRSKVKGNDEYGRWYLHGPYNITVGQPLHFRGDVENRPYVRTVAETVMHHIIEMARLSEQRMTQTPTPLASLPESL